MTSCNFIYSSLTGLGRDLSDGEDESENKRNLVATPQTAPENYLADGNERPKTSPAISHLPILMRPRTAQDSTATSGRQTPLLPWLPSAALVANMSIQEVQFRLFVLRFSHLIVSIYPQSIAGCIFICKGPTLIVTFLSWKSNQKTLWLLTQYQVVVFFLQVFDVLPLYGELVPGEVQQFQFTYYGHSHSMAEAIAVCSVHGGPDYRVYLKGQASLMQYGFSSTRIDLGRQVMCWLPRGYNVLWRMDQQGQIL